MKKKIGVLIILVFSIIFLNCKDTSKVNNSISDNKNEQNYFNPYEFLKISNGKMIASQNLINNTKSDIIKNAVIQWGSKGTLLVYDAKKNNPYHELFNTEKELKYKIENKILFITEDGKNWEKITVKIIDDNPNKKYNDARVVMIVYFISKWINGEYELIW